MKITVDRLREFYPPKNGGKTGPVFVSELGLTSNGRPVRTIDYRRNGIVTLSGSRPGHNGKPNRWEQTYRNTVPLDD